jgi:hypothetical protein
VARNGATLEAQRPNVKTEWAQGLTISQALLLRADQAIE